MKNRQINKKRIKENEKNEEWRVKSATNCRNNMYILCTNYFTLKLAFIYSLIHFVISCLPVTGRGHSYIFEKCFQMLLLLLLLFLAKQLTILIWNDIWISFITIGGLLIRYQLMMPWIIINICAIVYHRRWYPTNRSWNCSRVLLCRFQLTISWNHWQLCVLWRLYNVVRISEMNFDFV